LSEEEILKKKDSLQDVEFLSMIDINKDPVGYEYFNLALHHWILSLKKYPRGCSHNWCDHYDDISISESGSTNNKNVIVLPVGLTSEYYFFQHPTDPGYLDWLITVNGRWLLYSELEDLKSFINSNYSDFKNMCSNCIDIFIKKYDSRIIRNNPESSWNKYKLYPTNIMI
jgi:hypothetical protein